MPDDQNPSLPPVTPANGGMQTPNTPGFGPLSDPGAQASLGAQGVHMGGGMPQMDPPAPQQTVNPPAQPQQAPHPIKQALHGWQALMGTTTQYVQTPNGPQPVQVQNKPGQLFRSILAGAIMGAGAGAETPNPGGSGWKGAGAGIQAVQKNNQEQQAQAQQQAQQQFVNKLGAQKEQREQSGFETEQLVRKAQIAQANAETLKTNLLTQGSSFDLHQRVADADKDRISTYTDAGVKPVYENIPESEMTDILKNAAGASTLDWRHTGVKTVLDAQGNPTYQYTLSAYDPQQPLPLSKGTVDQWEKDGLFKYHPEYKDIATPGKTLTVGQFTALDKQAQGLYGQQLAKNKVDLETQHLQAQIGETKALVSEHYAQTRLANLGVQEKTEELAQKKSLDTAWEHLATVGNDPDKLTDPKDRIALAKGVAPVLAEISTAIKTAEANSVTDKDAAASLPGLWGQYTALSKLASLGGNTTPTATAPPTNPVDKAFEAIKHLDPGDAEDQITAATNLTTEQKESLRAKMKEQSKANAAERRGLVGGVLRQAVGLPPAIPQ